MKKSISVITVVVIGVCLIILLYIFDWFWLGIAGIVIYRNKKIKKSIVSIWNEKLPLWQSHLATLLKKLQKYNTTSPRKTDTTYRYSASHSDYSSSSFISSYTPMNLPSFKTIVLSII